MAIDRFLGHVEGFGDLGDGVFAFVVGAFVVIHLPGDPDLPLGQLRFPPTSAPAGPGPPLRKGTGVQRGLMSFLKENRERRPKWGTEFWNFFRRAARPVGGEQRQ